MADKCPKCGCEIIPGQQVLQIARGHYFWPAITPTYTFPFPVVAEFHFECYQEYPLRPQEQPYHCFFCGELIEDRTRVVYAVRGRKPTSGYIRPEHRGYELWLVAHEICWDIQQL